MNINTTYDIEAVKNMISHNRQIVIREVADGVSDMSFGSCQAIFTNVLGMRHAAAKFVLKLLYSRSEKIADIRVLYLKRTRYINNW